MGNENNEMRSKLARFLVNHRESIRAMINEGEGGNRFDFREMGRLVNDNLEMGPSFSQKVETTGLGIVIKPNPPYPTLAKVWEDNPDYHYGIIHTHPGFEGNDTLGPGDITTLSRPDCELMMVATQAGGRYQLVAKWDEEDGTQEGNQEEEHFDLYPRATSIANHLVWILRLQPWQEIAYDLDGDGKITSKDALKAFLAGRR